MKDWTGNARSIFSCNGATNHSEGEREKNDYYATEPKAVELLLEQEQFSACIWEPAAGEGHISEVLKANGYNVFSSDLIDRGYGQGNIDFFDCVENERDIITNPPYKCAKEFVEHALNISRDGTKIAMFLKLTFLESKKGENCLINTLLKQYMFHRQDYNVLKMAILKPINKVQERRSLMRGMCGLRGNMHLLKLSGLTKEVSNESN